MNEWGVVLVIATLIGLFVSVGKPIFNLIASITGLKFSVDALNTNLQKLSEDNEKQHEELWGHNSEQDKLLQEHGRRLHDLDGK